MTVPAMRFVLISKLMCWAPRLELSSRQSVNEPSQQWRMGLCSRVQLVGMK